MRLQNKHILLGITGSIAAYKVPELIRLLQKEGATVQVAVTPAALKFVTLLTLETLSGFPVLKNIFENNESMEHIQATRRADIVLIAPCTANSIAKFSYGMADDIVSATVLASNVKVLIAPAMNQQMWKNFLVQENLKKLSQAGYAILKPDDGYLACGEYGEGRLLDLHLIIHEVIKSLTDQDLSDQKVLVTGGGTREYLDPVRFISNASSGKMAFSLVMEAYYRGAQVCLISTGDLAEFSLPSAVKIFKAESAENMAQEVFRLIKSSDVFISAAAVSDYSPKKKSLQKIKKNKKDLVLTLIPTLDILSHLKKLKKRPLIVGFALETENLKIAARKKFIEKGLNLLVLNSQQAIGEDSAQVSFLSNQGFEHFPLLSKQTIARNIFNRLLK